MKRTWIVLGVVAAAVQGAMAQPVPMPSLPKSDVPPVQMPSPALGSRPVPMPALPTLNEACKQFAAAAERIQAPSVPIGPRGVWLRHADVAKGCAAKPQTGDVAAVQDAANEIAVAAAPYAEARP